MAIADRYAAAFKQQYERDLTSPFKGLLDQEMLGVTARVSIAFVDDVYPGASTYDPCLEIEAREETAQAQSRPRCSCARSIKMSVGDAIQLALFIIRTFCDEVPVSLRGRA